MNAIKAILIGICAGLFFQWSCAMVVVANTSDDTIRIKVSDTSNLFWKDLERNIELKRGETHTFENVDKFYENEQKNIVIGYNKWRANFGGLQYRGWSIDMDKLVSDLNGGNFALIIIRNKLSLKYFNMLEHDEVKILDRSEYKKTLETFKKYKGRLENVEDLLGSIKEGMKEKKEDLSVDELFGQEMKVDVLLGDTFLQDDNFAKYFGALGLREDQIEYKDSILKRVQSEKEDLENQLMQKISEEKPKEKIKNLEDLSEDLFQDNIDKLLDYMDPLGKDEEKETNSSDEGTQNSDLN